MSKLGKSQLRSIQCKSKGDMESDRAPCKQGCCSWGEKSADKLVPGKGAGNRDRGACELQNSKGRVGKEDLLLRIREWAGGGHTSW